MTHVSTVVHMLWATILLGAFLLLKYMFKREGFGQVL
jgi:hypothetical protein